jgi:hypothetical protein
MGWPDAIVAVGVLLDERQVLLGSDHRSGVAGKRHHRKDAEHGVDGAALETEVAEVGAREQGTVGLEQLGGGAPTFGVRVAVRAPLRRWLLRNRLEL